MMKRRIHRLVVCEQGKPTGVLSMTDIVRNLIDERAPSSGLRLPAGHIEMGGAEPSALPATPMISLRRCLAAGSSMTRTAEVRSLWEEHVAMDIAVSESTSPFSRTCFRTAWRR